MRGIFLLLVSTIFFFPPPLEIQLKTLASLNERLNERCLTFNPHLTPSAASAARDGASQDRESRGYSRKACDDIDNQGGAWRE